MAKLMITEPEYLSERYFVRRAHAAASAWRGVEVTVYD
jgi:hypothetical protein